MRQESLSILVMVEIDPYDFCHGVNPIFLSFEEARKFARGLGFKSQIEYKDYLKVGRSVRMPSHPDKAYKSEWKGWGDFLGTGNVHARDRKFLSFKKARIFVRKLGLKSQRGWYEYSKTKPDNIPTTPDKIYKGEWISWGDFLGTGNISNKGRIFLSFKKARCFVRKLGFKSLREYREYSKTGRPNNIPSSPNTKYKDSGWVSWPDFLGCSK